MPHSVNQAATERRKRLAQDAPAASPPISFGRAQSAPAAWAAYLATGEHVTAAEADA